MASLQCRNITYTGDFKPIERSCRAPLPSGSLCPRKDRIKVTYMYSVHVMILKHLKMNYMYSVSDGACGSHVV